MPAINKEYLEITLENYSKEIKLIFATRDDLNDYVKKTSTINNKELSGPITLTAADVGAIPASTKGAANGVATLDNTGKIPASQIPGSVDDIVEGVASEDMTKFKETGKTSYETPVGSKLYSDTAKNMVYRWSGSKLVAIGDPVTIAKSSNNGKISVNGSDIDVYTHPSHTAKSSGLYKVTINSLGHVSAATAVKKADITELGIPAQDTTYSNATTSAAGLMSAGDKTKLNGIDEGANNYVHPGSGTNPHGTTKYDVGLGDVGNFKAVSTKASQGLTATEQANARANIGAGTSSFSGSALDLTDKPFRTATYENTTLLNHSVLNIICDGVNPTNADGVYFINLDSDLTIAEGTLIAINGNPISSSPERIYKMGEKMILMYNASGFVFVDYIGDPNLRFVSIDDLIDFSGMFD